MTNMELKDKFVAQARAWMERGENVEGLRVALADLGFDLDEELVAFGSEEFPG
jgi:hypothetical protein